MVFDPKVTCAYPESFVRGGPTLTKFEATCCNSFCDILIASFQCQNLHRAITQKKKTSFFKFHQVISRQLDYKSSL